MVADSNPNGTMFGGWLMARMDIAGSIPAVRLAQGPVVTAAVKSMDFIKPLYLNDLVSLYGEVTASGSTSITVDVEVWVERIGEYPQAQKVANGCLVYVAVDNQGKARKLSSGN